MGQSERSIAHYLRNFHGRIVVHDKLKFIWVKSLKCAGTSVMRFFNTYHKDSLIHKFNGDDRWMTRLPQISEQQVEDYLIFTIVRNPYERFRSMCAYFGLSIEEVIRECPWTIDEAPWNDLIRHAKPLVEHIRTDDGVYFPDHILCVEHLDEDFHCLCEALGIDFHLLPHLRVSHGKQELREHQRQFIAERYAEDFKLFNYGV